MGMSTWVKGVRAPDAVFKKMLAVYESCKAAGLAPPREVEQFFGGCAPNPLGVQLDIDTAVTETDDARQHYTVDLKKLPAGVTHIVFTNGW